MKVGLCTMYSPSYSEMGKLCFDNIEEYCQRHGYEMGVISIDDNDAWYKKHESFEWMFRDVTDPPDILWYMDCDSLIMNFQKQITDFIDDEHSFFITKDFNELNGGSVIIRNTEAGRAINKNILSLRSGYDNEQNIYNSPTFQKLFKEHIKILPQYTINSYKYSLYVECYEYVGKHELGDYERGDLLIHFPGLNPQFKLQLMKEYSKQIIK